MVSAEELQSIVSEAQSQRIADQQSEAIKQQVKARKVINSFITYIVDETDLLQQEARKENTEKDIEIDKRCNGDYECDDPIKEEHLAVYDAYQELYVYNDLDTTYKGITVTFDNNDEIYGPLHITFDWS